MNEDFIENFLDVAERVREDCQTKTWEVPKDADKEKGDYGLLPEDKEIRAWAIPRSTAEFLRFFIISQNHQTVLELGSSIGYSTLWMGLGAQEIGGHVYTTEIFEPKAEEAKRNFEEAGLDDSITLLERDNKEVLENWDKGEIDLIFMDADKQNYKYYMELLMPLMSENGVIIADNAGDYPDYMVDFLEECKKSDKIASYFCDMDHGLMMVTPNSDVNLLENFEEDLPLLRETPTTLLSTPQEKKDFFERYLRGETHFRSDILVNRRLENRLGDIEGKRILSVEWGPGKLAHNMSEKGADVVKADVLENQNEILEDCDRDEDVEYVQTDIEGMKEIDGNFDIIIFSMVHLYLDEEEFEKSFEVGQELLSEEGKMFYGNIQPHRAISKENIERGVVSFHRPEQTKYMEVEKLRAKLRASTDETLMVEYAHYPLFILLNTISSTDLSINEAIEPAPSDEEVEKFKIISKEEKRIPPYLILEMEK